MVEEEGGGEVEEDVGEVVGGGVEAPQGVGEAEGEDGEGAVGLVGPPGHGLSLMDPDFLVMVSGYNEMFVR